MSTYTVLAWTEVGGAGGASTWGALAGRPPIISSLEAVAGTSTDERLVSAAVLKAAIEAHAVASVAAEDITDVGAVGEPLIRATTLAQALSALGMSTDVKAFNNAANKADARAAIGAGTSNLAIGSTAGTAKDGAWVPTAAEVGAAAVADVTALGTTVTALGTAVSSKADAATVTTALAGKSAVGHTHTAAQVGAVPLVNTGTRIFGSGTSLPASGSGQQAGDLFFLYGG